MDRYTMPEALTINRARIRNYFSQASKLNLKAVCAGAVLVLLGFYIHWIIVLSGLALIVAGFKMRVDDNHATDAEVDAAIVNDCADLAARAATRCGVESIELANEEPAVFLYAAGKNSNGVFAAGRLGKDGMYRQTPLSATVMHYASDQVLIYTCDIDLTTGNKINEGTRVFFYKDIVSIDSQSYAETYNVSRLSPIEIDKLKNNGYQIQANRIQVDASERISLRLMSGESIIIATSSGAFIDASWKSSGVDNNKELIRLRALFRQMKTSVPAS